MPDREVFSCNSTCPELLQFGVRVLVPILPQPLKRCTGFVQARLDNFRMLSLVDKRTKDEVFDLLFGENKISFDLFFWPSDEEFICCDSTPRAHWNLPKAFTVHAKQIEIRIHDCDWEHNPAEYHAARAMIELLAEHFAKEAGSMAAAAADPLSRLAILYEFYRFEHPTDPNLFGHCSPRWKLESPKFVLEPLAQLGRRRVGDFSAVVGDCRANYSGEEHDERLLGSERLKSFLRKLGFVVTAGQLLEELDDSRRGHSRIGTAYDWSHVPESTNAQVAEIIH